MKKIITLLAIAFCLNANAQFINLLDFAGATNGKKPYSALIQAHDGMLYGTTQQGGASTYGVIFQYNPATGTYTKKLDFTGTNGAYANGSLMQASDSMLYGMTQYGGGSTNCGSTGCGLIFQYNPATSTYTKKLDFAATNGDSPYGALIQASDGMLYGMAKEGGANNFGVIFQYNPVANTLTDKVDFAGTANGRTPYGSLVQASDGMLYGMPSRGGAKDSGLIFQYNPATNAFTDKVDFGSISKGGFPEGSLMQASDGMLYGMTNNGGIYNFGVLFQYNPTTSAYTKKLDFGVPSTATYGSYPLGSLMQASDGMLYGMTEYGGTNNVGVLFQYDPATSACTKMLDFAGTANGSTPYGNLMQASDGCLYGTAFGGGASGDGVLFKYCLGVTGIAQLKTNEEQISIYPNPSNGSFSVQTGATTKQTVQVYEMSGKVVLTQIINGTTTIDGSKLRDGIYNVSIASREGLVNKRLVIVK